MGVWPFRRGNKADTEADAPQLEEEHTPSIESWSEKDQKIHVVNRPGAELDLTVHAKVDATPDQVYGVLIDPHSDKIFRGINEITYRQVLEDDSKGRRKLEVGHKALVKFLFINVTFETRLHVWEDDVNRTVKFQLAKEGFMKDFRGMWEVKPFTQDTLDKIFKHQDIQEPEPAPKFFQFNPQAVFAAFQQHAKEPEATSTLLTLEQNIVPKVVPPGVVQRLVTRLTANQINHMLEDVRIELARKGAGTSADGGSKKTDKGVAAAAASITLSASEAWERFCTPLEVVVKLC